MAELESALRILVVYPVPNPDTCNLCAGLRARGHHVEFLTSFALSARIGRWIPALPWLSRIGLPLVKRVYAELDAVALRLRPDLTLRARWSRRRGADRVDAYELFDRAAARRIERVAYDVVVSPIGASRRSFAAAQRRGVTRVLNLPIVPLACLQPELEAERAIAPQRAQAFGLQLDSSRFAQEEAEFAFADGSLAPSEFVVEAVRRRFPSARAVHLVPFGARPPIGNVSPRRAAGPLRVLFAGQLVQRKGIFDLLAAVARLPAEQVELIVAGPAPFGTEIFGTGFARARYIGTLARPELARVMEGCDVLCLPTLAEGFPLVVLEAMAAGLPVIATDVCRGVVRDEENGLIVRRRAPEEIAGAMRRLQTDRARLARLASGARATAVAFPWSAYQRRAAEAIERIAQEALTRPA